MQRVFFFFGIQRLKIPDYFPLSFSGVDVSSLQLHFSYCYFSGYGVCSKELVVVILKKGLGGQR
jgi:hypothetical protein